MLKTIIDGIREDFGRPAKLIQLLEAHPDIRISLLSPSPPSIDADSVAPWHELGDGSLMGWTLRGKYDYGSFLVHRPEFGQLGMCEVTDNWQCDITDVHGFAASKSPLHKFLTTDQMVEAESRELIDEISDEKLAGNLAHNEVRIIHSPGSDYFHRHSWDGRVFLINSGGSHHFAAAKYIAARLPKPVPLRGKLHTYSLNPNAIISLRRDFEMFVISADNAVSDGFHDAMASFRATWLWHSMPQQFGSAKAILLPRTERRSMLVADQLRKAGVVDLGAHLAHVAASQSDW